MSSGDLGKRNAFGDFKPGPTRLERTIQISCCLNLCCTREVVTPLRRKVSGKPVLGALRFLASRVYNILYLMESEAIRLGLIK